MSRAFIDRLRIFVKSGSGASGLPKLGGIGGDGKKNNLKRIYFINYSVLLHRLCFRQTMNLRFFVVVVEFLMILIFFYVFFIFFKTKFFNNEGGSVKIKACNNISLRDVYSRNLRKRYTAVNGEKSK